MKTRAEECKEEGNRCMKEGKYTEAVIHYTEGVKNDPNSAILHSNRSFAFLKLEQFYLAMEDAKMAIKLEPNWPKGFYRKGEIEFKAGHFQDALHSYRKAMILDPNDSGLASAVSKANKELNKDKKDAAQTPIMYSLIGLVVGIAIVAADQYIPVNPSLKFLPLQVFVACSCAGIGYAVARVKRYIAVSHRNSLLEEPIDILKEYSDDKKETETSNPKTNSHTHHNQTAGRQRMRKGKS